jgi:hypothetical protein
MDEQQSAHASASQAVVPPGVSRSDQPLAAPDHKDDRDAAGTLRDWPESIVESSSMESSLGRDEATSPTGYSPDNSGPLGAPPALDALDPTLAPAFDMGDAADAHPAAHAHASRPLPDVRWDLATLRTRVSAMQDRARTGARQWKDRLQERLFPPNAYAPPAREEALPPFAWPDMQADMQADLQVDLQADMQLNGQAGGRGATHASDPLDDDDLDSVMDSADEEFDDADYGPVPLPPFAPRATQPLYAAPRDTLPLYTGRRTTRPVARRRWRDPRQHMLLVSSLIVLASMFISILIPGLAMAGALKDYNDLRAIGESGVHHLLAAETDLSGLSSLLGKKSGTTTPGTAQGTAPSATPTATPTPASGSGSAATTGGGGLLDPAAFHKAEGELQAAQGDFQRLRDRLDHPDWVLATAVSTPGLDAQLRSVHALADVGYDVASMGVDLFDAALPLITRLHGASLSETELLTPDDLTRIQQAISHTLDLLTDVQAKLSGVSFSDLPLSAKQKSELAKVMVALPQVRGILTQGAQLLGAVGWVLGVGQARHFLVQTLDRAELRASGGFAGNYGILTVSNGKLDPFSLYNVNDIDYGYKTNGWIFGRRPPPQYSWWPFANWGLRDANLSPDFPSSAQMVMDVFQHEGGGTVDGLIQVSPVAIEHVLRITGPIYVPGYNETVTADNLEQKIHYYQQDPAGIAKEARLNPGDHTHSLRKRFTQYVVQLLQDKVKHLPQNELLPLAKQVLKDLQAKDIELYFANQQVESLLQQVHATSAIDTTAGIDGYYFTQANTSVAKSTPYIDITQRDDVTLDDQGGAKHHLVITLYNSAAGPYYGYETLRDYVRIYVPSQAQLQGANGFDTGQTLCWAPPMGGAAKPAMFAAVPYCLRNPYPSRALVCAGAYGPGPQASSVFGSDGHTPWVLDRLGWPPATTSDVQGRAMWGGYVVVPRYCTATLTLDYYVPNVAAPASGLPANAAPYSMLIQRQGGTFYTVNVTIHPSPSMAAKGMGTMTYTPLIDDSTGITFGKQGTVPGSTLLGVGSLSSLFDLLNGK